MATEELYKLLFEAEAIFNQFGYNKFHEIVEKLIKQIDEAIPNSDIAILRIETNLLLSRVAWKQGFFEKTIKYASIALSLSDELEISCNKEEVYKAKSYNMIGLAYWRLNNLANAISNYHKALGLSEKLGEKKGVAVITGNIGVIYSSIRDYARAFEFYSRALSAHIELNNMEAVAETYCNLGIAKKELKEYDEALSHFLKAKELFGNLSNKSQVFRMNTNIGDICLQRNKFNDADSLFQDSLSIYEELGLYSDIGFVKNLLGSLYSRKEFAGYDPEIAKKYLLESIEVFKDIGNESKISDIYLILTDVSADERDWRAQSEYLKQYQERLKSEYDDEVNKQILRYTMDYELSALQREQEILKEKNAELAELNNKLLLANRQLVEADEEKNDFMGIAAHDLKNPLGSVTMIANILANESETISTAEIYELATDIRTLSKRMFELITSFLDLNKADLGITHNDVLLFPISDVINPIIDQYEPSAQLKGITITSSISAIMLCNSPSILTQILDNLISNAVKYTLQNTEITITTELIDEGHLRIGVADQGPGLTESDRQNIFGKFKRLSAQPTGGEHSSGLGLAIVKKLVEAIGGCIYFESELGRGTAFYVELPRKLLTEL